MRIGSRRQIGDVYRIAGIRKLMKLASEFLNIPHKSVTPRLRREVRRRDRGCIVPGCTNHFFIDLHHHQFQSRGGAHSFENLYCLCTQHHRLVHEGLLAIEGSLSEGFVVRHANGTLYGTPRAVEERLAS